VQVDAGRITLFCVPVPPQDDRVSLLRKIALLHELCGDPVSTRKLGFLLIPWQFPTYRFRDVLVEATSRNVRWLSLNREQSAALKSGPDAVKAMVRAALAPAPTPTSTFDLRGYAEYTFERDDDSARPPNLDRYFVKLPSSSADDEGFEVK
jgi:hypothetical protein